MGLLNRRAAFKDLLDGLLQTAGTVLLASAVLPARAAEGATGQDSEGSGKSLQQRADQVAAEQAPLNGDVPQPCAFVNGAFTNSTFHNGGFANGGGFHNGSFSNGSFHNGGFTNGGFRNGGFANAGWRN
jgi:hypothetical protein